jgi:hypothetical protein
MPLTKASYSMITGASANVLDYGADPTGVADSTAAFTAAIATGKRVWIPNGTYSAAAINLPSGTQIEGESRSGVQLKVRANSEGFFTYAYTQDCNLSNFTVGVDSGVTNARFIKQTDHTAYTSYSTFTNIETRAEFLYSYDGFFIFTTWKNCRDGYIGNAGATHVFIKSTPDNSAQFNQTNLCQVVQCQIFRATGTLGAVNLSWGTRWDFINTDFEANLTNAVQAAGIQGLSFNGCWFENNSTSYIIYCVDSAAPNAQGTAATINNCYYSGLGGNVNFLYLAGASYGAVTNLVAISVPTGCTLSNLSTLVEMYGVSTLSGAGASAFNNVIAYRDKINLQMQGINGITTGYVDGTTPTLTGINVNAGQNGRTYLLTWSFQTSTGNNTASSLYMIRAGFSGDNYTATKISGDQGGTVGYDVITFSLSINSILQVAGAGAGNGQFGILSN